MSTSSTDQRIPRRRFRAIGLALATIVVLAAGILPACVPGMCCPVTDTPTVHTQMPCCQGQDSIASSDLDEVRPATFAGHSFKPQTWAVAAVSTQTASPVAHIAATRNRGRDAHHQPSPPLFLLNAQFLI
jgi:hypothetical protein